METGRSGPHVKTYLRSLGRQLGSDESLRVLRNAQRLFAELNNQERPTRQGLFFGQIQSGKTGNMLMSICLAADAGLRLFIILTSDNTWLYEQTLERVKQALPGMLSLGKNDWDSLNSDATRIEVALTHSSLVLVATKNQAILTRLQQFITEYCPNSLKAIIFDDEADQASLNTLVNMDNDEVSAINQAIVTLREFFPAHVYVQVTATPQALLLQSAETRFSPEFTVVFEPGAGYIGGEAFFETPGERSPIRTFPEEEVEDIVSSDAAGGLAAPTGLRQALCSFFVGAAVKLLSDEGTSFSCLCHISHRQAAHARLAATVNGFITALIRAMLDREDAAREIARKYLYEAYRDLQNMRDSLPPFEDVGAEIANNIAGTNVQVLIANSEARRPTYDAPFNILVGGNRLGRGVTIDRLLVTYYGRTSRAPQLDTVLQHARMYGYRQRDLDVIRFFITEGLRDLFTSIFRSERQLRLMVERDDPSAIRAIVLSRNQGSNLRATRPSVVYADSIVFYLPGERYFPTAPKASSVDVLDRLLERYVGRNEPTVVAIDTLIEIVNLTSSEPDASGSWDDEAIRACLRNMKAMFSNRGFLVVRKDRDIARGSRAMLSPDDYSLFNPGGPTLTVYRYVSSLEKGWDGVPRWVPNIRFPDGPQFFLYTAW